MKRAFLFIALLASFPVLSSEVHKAVEKNDLTKLRELVEKDERWLDITFPGKRTALHAAVESGNLDAAKILLKRPAQLRKLDDNGRSPFHLAIQRGSEPLVKFFLENEADLVFPNSEGYSPLHIAVWNLQKSNIAIAQMLLEKGADPNIKRVAKYSEETPLNEARSAPMLKLLIEKGGNVQIRNGSYSLLHAHFRDPLSLALLLDHKVDIDAQDAGGQTPLHRAVEYSVQPSIELLVERGANLNLLDSYKRTPLDVAEFSWPGTSYEDRMKKKKLADFLKSKGAKSGKELPKPKEPPKKK